MSFSDHRSELYEKLSKDLEENGAAFIDGSPLFESNRTANTITPILKPANPPVRACVLHLSSEHAMHISRIIREVFMPYFEGAIWFQNENLYHSSMFHTSHQHVSVHASEAEIQAEVNSIESIACSFSPLRIRLDKVVLTSNGALLGCWQVMSGVDPVAIRTQLKEAILHAPEKQLYDLAILHTSFARIVGHPCSLIQEAGKILDLLTFCKNLVEIANSKLRGFEAIITEMWFVEEFDLFALALNGRMRVCEFQLCAPAS